MRARSLEILAITAFFLNYAVENVNGQTNSESTINESSSGSDKNSESSVKNASAVQRPTEYWMAKMGSVQSDLMNIQAIVVKDENVQRTCNNPAERKSNKRYLMCGGSILNRNHVLTSATCLHDATHIRHNIRAPLAVVIAPLKSSIQVISVREYKIHPQHHTNPHAPQHLKHNVAIIKLACRISMENFHKIELPRSPMIQTCSEENCVVAAFRKTGRTNTVMFQMLAPDMPYPNRRRKETSMKDMKIRRSADATDDVVVGSGRAKRKLAEPPIFVGKSKSGKRLNDDTMMINPTPETTTENSTMDATSVPRKLKNVVPVGETSLYDDVAKALKGSVVGNGTIRSLVVRSSGIHRTCALTGSPIIVNKTQAALVAVPCDARQASSRWHYSDLYNSLEWIHKILEHWESLPSVAQWLNSTTQSPQPERSGNHSGCSTCIFNFFFEIGCKDKDQCGKNFTGPNAPDLPGQEAPQTESIVVDGARRTGQHKSQQQGCSGTGDSVGAEAGAGRGCEKTGKETENRSEYGGKSEKSSDIKLSEVEEQKPTSMVSPDATKEIAQRPDQPVTGHPIVAGIDDYVGDKDKFGKIDSRISDVSQTYKTPIDANFHRDRATNEIGSQTNDGETSDWLSEVEKGLELNTAVKRDLIKTRRLIVE